MSQLQYTRKIKMVEKKRNSGIELLRIIAMFGIICMHTFAWWYQTATGVNQVYGVIINTLFNASVSIFMIISGYFGLEFRHDKLIKIVFMVWCYSIFSWLIQGTLFDFIRNDISSITEAWEIIKTHLTFKEITTAFFPILSNRYWYASCYVVLLLFAPYPN